LDSLCLFFFVLPFPLQRQSIVQLPQSMALYTSVSVSCLGSGRAVQLCSSADANRPAFWCRGRGALQPPPRGPHASAGVSWRRLPRHGFSCPRRCARLGSNGRDREGAVRSFSLWGGCSPSSAQGAGRSTRSADGSHACGTVPPALFPCPCALYGCTSHPLSLSP
jgi:hypothetical protein